MLLPVLAKSMGKDVSSPTIASTMVPLCPSAPSTGGMVMVRVWEIEVGITFALLWVEPRVGVAVMGMESEPETE